MPDDGITGWQNCMKPKVIDPPYCLLCGGTDASLLFATTEGDESTMAQHPFVRCATCGLIYVYPQPVWAERQRRYTNDYRGYHRLETEKSAWTRRSMYYGLYRRYQLVKHYQSAGRLLDIGCSGGDFANWVAQQPGWQVFGVERVPDMAEIAHHQYGFPALVGDGMQLGLAPNAWDTVTMWTVLEHMANPIQGVRECCRVLRPGGVFIIQTVSAESLASRLFGRYWLGYDTPRILYVFSRLTLKRLLEENGFKLLWMGCYFHDYYPLLWSWCNFCDLQTLTSSGPANVYEWIDRIAHTKLVRLTSYPFLKLLTILGKSSFLVAVARKVG